MLTPEQIKQAWENNFSTNNPFCSCTLEAFKKCFRIFESLVTKEKDVEIVRLNAVTNLQLETISDLENRLEKVQPNINGEKIINGCTERGLRGTSLLQDAAVQVCFDLDRACGDFPQGWCAHCPKRRAKEETK
jgi:hypothetical protein